MSCSALPGISDVHAISRTWNGVEVRYTERRPGPGESWTSVIADNTTVIIRLDQRGGICEPRLKPETPTATDRHDAGFFNWIPQNRQIWCYADNVRCVRDLQLRFDQSAFEAIVGSDHKKTHAKEPLLMVYDNRVARCAGVLADALASGYGDDALYGESVMTALLVALERATEGQRIVVPADGLASWQLRIVEDYIDQNFAHGISLSSLAKLVGLSQSRFARGFKASTGLAPYSRAIQARIERAKSLLADGDMSLSVIGLEVGFADQSHFTKAFKRSVGITPGEWRRNRKP